MKEKHRGGKWEKVASEIRNHLAPWTTQTRAQGGSLPPSAWSGGSKRRKVPRPQQREGLPGGYKCVCVCVCMLMRAHDVWPPTNLYIQWGKNMLESLAWRPSMVGEILQGNSCFYMSNCCLKVIFLFQLLTWISVNYYRELYVKCKSGQAIEITPFLW